MQRKQFATRPKRIALFVTCMVDMLYPDVGMATVELLEAQGVEVIFPEEQTCCGQPAFNSGFRDETRAVARHFLDVFEPLLASGQVDALVAPSGSCTAMVAHYYTVLFAENPADAADLRRAQSVAAATFELTEFLVDVLGVTATGAHLVQKVTYHACCHTAREMGIDRQPHLLLAAVEGIREVPLQGADECCGFGGTFAVKNGPISSAMGQRKAANVVATGADLVAVCDVSCMMHINGILSRQQQAARAVHIAELLVAQDEDALHLLRAADDATSPPPDAPPPAKPAGPPPPPHTEPPPTTVRPRRWQDVQ
jgi:L-lactate dehydrogenase complex protein LldE